MRTKKFFFVCLGVILLLATLFCTTYIGNYNPNKHLYKNNTKSLSVIIPLAPNETAWKNLIKDFAKLPDGTEILFVTSNKTKHSHELINLPQKKVYWLKSTPGRANQMNAGAQSAKGEYLWFLHADSKFDEHTIPALLHSIQNYPNSLLFFDLAFLNDATPLMYLNAFGARFRSRILNVPFGDQGFCINKKLFNKLNGFPEGLAYGEDHVFVWKARQQGVPIQPTGATLYTSARKYKEHGWLKTTITTQYLWIKQALPEIRKLYSEMKIL